MNLYKRIYLKWPYEPLTFQQQQQTLQEHHDKDIQ